MLHALEMPPGAYADWYAFLNLVDLASIQNHMRRQLDFFETNAFAGVKVNRVLVDGRAGPSIVEFAEQRGVDLIMMPTRGLTRFRALLLGSVTSYVLHDALCPVWTAAHQEIDAPANPIRTVLCAVDLSETTPALLGWARDISGAFAARLHVIHVDAPGSPRSQTALNKYGEFAAATGVDAELELIAGAVADAVVQAVERHAADLLLIGRGRIRGTLGRLRDHSHALIRRSPCPVLSI